MMTRLASVPGSLLAGVAAAVGASACCAGPLLLVMLGVGGAWGSRLVALEPLQPYLVAAALLFFALAWRRLYRPPQACAPEQPCATPPVRRRQRIVFWAVAGLAAASMTLPLYAPLFY